MKVHEIMTGHARTVPSSSTLVEAAGLMRQLDVGALPVYEGESLVGMVTDRDIVVRGVAEGRDPNSAMVSDVMSSAVEAIFADEEVEQAARIMERRQIRRLPVLDRQKRLVGIVSLGDVATSSQPAFSGMALRDVSMPREPNARQRGLAQLSEPIRMPPVPGAPRRPKATQGGNTQGAAKSGRTRARRAPTRVQSPTQTKSARSKSQAPRTESTRRRTKKTVRSGRR